MNTVLIVEDDNILRENLCNFLSNEGYKVLIAENGLKAYQQVLRNSPDVIVSDIHMPYMDGLELMSILNKNNKTKSTPFIFITADIEKPKLEEALAGGAKEYITKPFELDDLLKKIDDVVDKNPEPQLKIKRMK
jgi:CheY-like chemotaxis protein